MKPSTACSPLENHLQSILDQLDSQSWTIKELLQALKGKGYPFLIILLSLPFCQPIQIPGFSTPFGIILMIIGLRMIFRRRIWWPQWILRKKISTKILKSIIQKSLIFFRFLSPLLHQRWSRMCTDPLFLRFHGAFVMLMGFYLALPLPIPLSNLLAAWALLLLGLGLIEEDGLFIFIGYVVGCVAWIVLGFLIGWLHHWVTSV